MSCGKERLAEDMKWVFGFWVEGREGMEQGGGAFDFSCEWDGRDIPQAGAAVENGLVWKYYEKPSMTLWEEVVTVCVVGFEQVCWFMVLAMDPRLTRAYGVRSRLSEADSWVLEACATLLLAGVFSPEQGRLSKYGTGAMGIL